MSGKYLINAVIIFCSWQFMLSAQTVTEHKVYKNACTPGEEWNGWQAVSRPYFSYNFSIPFTNVQIRVSNTPYGGTYDQNYTFNNGNKCNQWPFDLPTGRYTWQVRVYYQQPPNPYRWSDLSVGPDFYVDVDPPSSPAVTEHHCGGISSGWPAWTTHNTPYFTWNPPSDAGSGISHYQVSVNSGGWNTVSSGWHPTYEGSNVFTFRAVDNAGNVSPGYNIYVRIDNTPPPTPIVTVEHCRLGIWTAHTSPFFFWTPVWDLNGSGINRYEVSVNGSSWTSVTPPWHPVFGTGQYTFIFRSVDNVGLVSGIYMISGIYIDDTPPQKPVVTEIHCGGTTGENPPWSTHTSPYFSFALPSDEGSGVPLDGCQVSVNSGDWTTVFPGWHPELTKGSYTFDFRATDRVGHISEVYRLYVRINPGNRIYVKHDATGNNDGSSWENAFTSLQAALSSALEDDTIWIAKGTYKPSADKNGDPNPSDPRRKTFKLVSKVALYGGFAGNETSMNARNPLLNLTYLSGDIGNAGDNADNCYSVITGVNNAAIDGFIITGGNGNGTVSLETDLGGGISNNGIKKIRVSNCIFKNNFAKQGGAIGNYFCTDSIIIKDCRFIENSGYNGGAIGNWDTKTYIINCIFEKNTTSSSNSYGAAVFNWGSKSTGQIINSTVYNNLDETSRGAIHNRACVSSVINSIIWGNNQNDIVNSNGGNCSVSYTCIEQSGYAGSNGNISTDPGFADPVNGDFRLTSGSPCIDAGNGDFAPPVDISGNPREDDPATANTGSGNPDYTDMGAFEYLFTTGYVQNKEDIITIFPNPASGTFRITGTGVCDLEIIDITGNLIRRFRLNPEEMISVTVPPGTYFIKIKNLTKTIVKKIIIL